MLSISDLKPGRYIILKGDPFEIIRADHSIHGRGGAVLKTKVKNLKTGNVIDHTFKGNDTAEEAELENVRATYLYKEGDKFAFMDENTYEQFELSEAQVGGAKNYLVEQAPVKLLKFEGQPIKLDLPIKMDFEVTEAPPNIKGNTATQGTKDVTIETGARVAVPLFVEEGDKIRINTETGKYVERSGQPKTQNPKPKTNRGSSFRS